MTYAAYLRIYEPVSAFHEPDRSRWAAYAASSPGRGGATRSWRSMPRRCAGPLRHRRSWCRSRRASTPYVRRADGITYVCPWQTRLRCLLAYGRMLSAAGAPLPGTIPRR